MQFTPVIFSWAILVLKFFPKFRVQNGTSFMLTVNFAKSAAFFRTSFYSNPSKWLPNLIGMVIEKFFELTHLNFENLNQKNSTWNRIRLGWCFRWFWPNLRLAVLIVVVLMKQRLFEWKKTIVKVWEDEIKSKFSGIKKNIKIKITCATISISNSFCNLGAFLLREPLLR